VQPTITRHQSAELGRLEHAERGPAPGLGAIVHRYCGYDHTGTGVARRREVAQDQVTIILGLGPSLRVGGPTAPAREFDSFVAPLHDSFAITEERGGLRGIQVDLSPLGAHLLFGEAMHELSAQLVIALEDVLGERTVSDLLERLAGAASWPARFALLDEFIARRVIEARPATPDVVWAWRRLRDTGGLVPIGELTSELGCSHRHLVNRFHEQLGPAPKTVARLLRFRRAVDQLERDTGRRFAEIAQDCGFYDQAHLNREFRQLAGTTPGEFIARRLPDGLGIAA
jgi:AraC-like DNA-binding protein